MLNRISLLIVCIIITSPLYARDLNAVMQQLGNQMLVILPELYNEDLSIEKLQADIVSLTALLNEAEPHLSKADPATRAKYEMLRSRLNQFSQYSEHSNRTMLKSDLSESFSLCASCHNKDRGFVRNYGISKFRHMDEFLAAEYGYLTRDYDSAVTSYRNFIESDPQDQKKIQTTLDRLLVITLEVSADPELAYSIFSEIQKTPAARKEFGEDLDDWLQAIKRLVAEPKSLHSPIAATSIIAMDNYLRNEWPAVQTRLTQNEQVVYWIAIRGRLNSLLEASPGSREVPRLLYWLAVSDRALHYRFYNSLSRRYLERCIRDYPSHQIAEECFNEYEMLMIVSFSGSGGVYLPLEAQEEINELRRLVYVGKSGDKN